MVLGDVFAKNLPTGSLKNKLVRYYVSITGTPYMHSHIKWKAIKRYVNFNLEKYAEVGAGAGLITFEIAKKNSGNILGIIYTDEDYEIAIKTNENNSMKNFQFVRGDITDLSGIKDKFDQVLCIDVLEHVQDDKKAL